MDKLWAYGSVVSWACYGVLKKAGVSQIKDFEIGGKSFNKLFGLKNKEEHWEWRIDIQPACF